MSAYSEKDMVVNGGLRCGRNVTNGILTCTDAPFSYVISQVLKPEDYRQVMDTVQQAILSTDLEQYFKTKPQFLQVVKDGEPDWHDPHNKKCK